MGVTTTFTNKPINPRGNDASPLGYNRAALYSGKALDFDGVNDSIDISNFSLNGYTAFSICFYKPTSFPQNRAIFSSADDISDGFNLYQVSPGYFRARLNGANVDTDTLVSQQNGFFVFTYNGSEGVWYQDGQSIGTGTTSQTLAITNTTSTIGRFSYSASSYLDGQIAGFKIFNTALTPAQVSDLYNNPEKIVPTGVSNDALKLWLPMMEGAGTTAYDGSAPLTDYVTNGDFSDGTNNWTASNATLSVENGALKITSTGGNRPQANQTITGLTIGRKYLLSAVARVGTTPYNMEIEIAGIGASGSYNKTNNSTDTYIYYEFTASSTSHQIQAKIDNDPVPIGETGYFDNIKLLDLGNYGTISGATWVQGVGAPVAQTAVIDWNKWYLDHSNEVLIPQGLTAGRDLLGNLFENVRKQGALNLDGNSWAEVHDNESLDFGTGSFTLEAWVKVAFKNVGSALNVVLALGGDATTYSSIYAYDGGIGFYYNGYNAHSKAVGEWTHIVAVYNGTNAILYFDAVSKINNTKTAVDITNAFAKRIGSDSGTSRYYQDQIAQPRIYNRALTAEEVLRNYNSEKNTYQ